MTAPRLPAQRKVAWYARPAIVLPIVAALIAAVALVTPQATTGRAGDARLTTYSTAPMGARMFWELAQRLGWRAEEDRAVDWVADTSAIVAELDPVVPLRSAEVHALLERVRHGGALLAMLGPGSRLLADSLHVGIGQGRERRTHSGDDAAGCPRQPRVAFSTRMLSTIWPGDAVTLSTLVWRRPPPDAVERIVLTDPVGTVNSRTRRPAAVGFPYGRGRIVVGADPDLLRNDAIRVCEYGLGVMAVRMLEYLDLRENGSDAHRRILFDEYHQGYGEQRGSMEAVAAYLVGVGSGRLLFQLLAAGLVLLLAAAPRLIPPFDPEFIERRSPLEHVDALGRAYAQVGATRSATARLLRGVRRRLEGGAIRGGVDATDDAFLDRAQREAPRIAGDIDLIRRALRSPISRRDFASIGAALERLELSLTRT